MPHAFAQVFASGTEQATVFAEVAELVQSALDGYQVVSAPLCRIYKLAALAIQSRRSGTLQLHPCGQVRSIRMQECVACAPYYGELAIYRARRSKQGDCSSLRKRRGNVRVCLLSYEQTGAGKGDDA